MSVRHVSVMIKCKGLTPLFNHIVIFKRNKFAMDLVSYSTLIGITIEIHNVHPLLPGTKIYIDVQSRGGQC